MLWRLTWKWEDKIYKVEFVLLSIWIALCSFLTSAATHTCKINSLDISVHHEFWITDFSLKNEMLCFLYMLRCWDINLSRKILKHIFSRSSRVGVRVSHCYMYNCPSKYFWHLCYFVRFLVSFCLEFLTRCGKPLCKMQRATQFLFYILQA